MFSPPLTPAQARCNGLMTELFISEEEVGVCCDQLRTAGPMIFARSELACRPFFISLFSVEAWSLTVGRWMMHAPCLILEKKLVYVPWQDHAAGVDRALLSRAGGQHGQG